MNLSTITKFLKTKVWSYGEVMHFHIIKTTEAGFDYICWSMILKLILFLKRIKRVFIRKWFWSDMIRYITAQRAITCSKLTTET